MLIQPLNEIWTGGSSKRLLFIDIRNQKFYYSVAGGTTSAYKIEETCLTRNGSTRFILSNVSNNGTNLQVFFVRNIKNSSIEFSFCENTYPTKEEAYKVTESNCDHFNFMNLYYEKDPNKIYLPVNGGDLEKTEANKLSSLKGKTTTTVTIYQNLLFLPMVDSNTANRYIRQAGIINKILEPASQAMRASSPFIRSYLAINVEAEPGKDGKDPVKEPVKQPPVDQRSLIVQRSPIVISCSAPSMRPASCKARPSFAGLICRLRYYREYHQKY
ncbi:hypothetical protein [Paraflavitalea speifideaquila]|uniref:hypothetical protein n=1 Tax=Paraflavitalea speifideaquila TaxID=3076558 RepID=UPI0028E9357B|nr:hypothetical protein [Paraflavitalea speifideiaquila]